MSTPSLGYSLLFRITPQTGEQSTVNLGGLLPGSLQWSHAPERVDVDYDLVQRDRETANYEDKPLFLGWRRRVAMTIALSGDVTELQNDQALLLAIVNGATDPETTIEISLDNGENYFEARLARYQGPDPFGTKIHAGVRFTIAFKAAKLITQLRAFTDSLVDSVPAGW